MNEQNTQSVISVAELIEFQKARAEGPFWQDAAILQALKDLSAEQDDSARIDWLETCCVGAGSARSKNWMAFGDYDKTASLREAIDAKRLES